MNSEEERLVKACVHRNERACKQLYDKYAAKMMGVCLRFVGTRDVAEDILLEGFIKVFANLGTLNEQTPLEPWIRRIILNTAINYVRHHHPMESMEAPEVQCRCAEVDYDRYDMGRILEAIQQLPALQRMVFNLYEIEGYKHVEIAEQLGLQPASVRSVLHRARRTLAEQLGSRSNYE